MLNQHLSSNMNIIEIIECNLISLMYHINIDLSIRSEKYFRVH